VLNYFKTIDLKNQIMSNPRRLNHLFAKQSSQLSALIEHAKQLNRLTKILRGLTPEPLSRHIAVGNISATKLTLIADSPVWLTKLRYHAPEILKPFSIQTGLPQFRDVRYKVSPTFLQKPSTIVNKNNKLSSQAIAQIESVANALEDPKLKHALLRLAQKPY
jgi:hypothetical protein